jgi:hypothetical protein
VSSSVTAMPDPILGTPFEQNYLQEREQRRLPGR